MDQPRCGAKGYGILLIAGWVTTGLVDLVPGLRISNFRGMLRGDVGRALG